MAKGKTRLTGREKLILDGSDLPESTVLDFWQWAFSDLKANYLRGVIPEWMMAKLLKIDQPLYDS